MQLVKIHIIIPQIVGKMKPRKVHFQELVSFFIVSKVVVHGKCKIVNIITFIAVIMVQPF